MRMGSRFSGKPWLVGKFGTIQPFLSKSLSWYGGMADVHAASTSYISSVRNTHLFRGTLRPRS